MDDPAHPAVPSGLGLLFNSVATDYDAVRPGYPDELFDELAAIAGLGASSRVLEIGPGTGIATRSLLARGWRVRAIEPGADLAEVARARSAGASLVVEHATFEGWHPDARRFDLVFSATAFHWVEPDVRWVKAAAVLEEGGHLALMTNRTVAGGSFHELDAASVDLHRRHAPGMTDEGTSPAAEELIAAMERKSGDIGLLWSVAEPKGGALRAGRLFEPPLLRSRLWEHEYGAKDAVRLLSTYSAYLALSGADRERVLAGIEALIDERFGGSVVRRFLSILAVARRVDQPGAT